MSFETPAIIGSIVMIVMSGIAVALGRRPARPAPDRTITITIEASSGERARVITRSSRRVDEVKRDFERLVSSAA